MKLRRRNPRKIIKPAKGMTWQKARVILHHGEVRGHPLTDQQRKLFGAWFTRLKPKSLSREAALKKALQWEKKYGKKKKSKKKLKRISKKSSKRGVHTLKKLLRRQNKCRVCKKKIKQRHRGRPRLVHERCK